MPAPGRTNFCPPGPKPLNVIEICGLRKIYGHQEVLHGVDLAVPRGRLTGFLGPNGAGKTTTIRILLGLVRRSSGTARLFGRDVSDWGPHLRREIGYLPADIRFPAGLTGRAALLLYARARQVACSEEIQRLAVALELNLDKRIRSYSTGMKQKLGLIQALMHQPDLLILDEPTTGLDPLVRETVFRELRHFMNGERTILFSSHSLGEVEQLCDDVVILRDGNIIENQSIESLRKLALRRLSIEFCSPASVPENLPAAFQLVHRNGARITGNWSAGADSLVLWLGQMAIDDVTIEKPDLEDLFLTYYSDRGQPSSAISPDAAAGRQS